MKLVSPEIESYCVEHSAKEPAVRQELAEYTRANCSEPQMLIGPIEANFLQLLIRQGGVKRILEIGCYTGYSAMAMAEALPEDGKILSLDVNEETSQIARRFWDKSGLGKKIEVKVAPALETLESVSGEFDLVFIDADKQNGLRYVQKALSLLSSKGLVIVDNTLWSGRVTDPAEQEKSTQAIREMNDWVARQEGLVTSLFPIRDGILVIRKK